MKSEEITDLTTMRDKRTVESEKALTEALLVLNNLQDIVKQQVLGRDNVIELAIVAMIADGHILLEDFPGSGKTTLAKALGEAIEIEGASSEQIVPFRRIQFTPDLLPSDVTGVPIFDANSNEFHFRHGPLFAHVVLADEINRTSPKVQSAMLSDGRKTSHRRQYYLLSGRPIFCHCNPKPPRPCWNLPSTNAPTRSILVQNNNEPH